MQQPHVVAVRDGIAVQEHAHPALGAFGPIGAMLKAAGGVPPYGNQRSAWDSASKADEDNPEHR